MDYTWVECTCGVGKDHFTKERKHDVKSPEFDFREYEAEEDELIDHEWPFRVKASQFTFHFHMNFKLILISIVPC